MKKIKVEFFIKRAQVNMDDIYEKTNQKKILKSIKLIKKGDYKGALDALPELFFEWAWSNSNCDPKKYFKDFTDKYFKLTPENSNIQIGIFDEKLILTVHVFFDVLLKKNSRINEIEDWFDDNSIYACGYIDGGWSYIGDDGCGIRIIA